MHDSSTAVDGQTALSGIADRTEGIAQALALMRDQQEGRCRQVFALAASQMRLYSEAIRLASHAHRGQTTIASAALAADAGIAGIAGRVDAWSLLDEYASCHLLTLAATLRMIEAAFSDCPRLPEREVGMTLYECTHWIDRARADLVDLLDRGVGVAAAA